MRPKSLTHFTDKKTDIQRDQVACSRSRDGLGTLSRRGWKSHLGTKFASIQGLLSVRVVPRSGKAEPSAYGAAGVLLPSHHQEGGACWPERKAGPELLCLMTTGPGSCSVHCCPHHSSSAAPTRATHSKAVCSLMPRVEYLSALDTNII